MKPYAVYILASKRNGTLYTGVTNDIERRVAEHKEHIYNGFSHTYNVTNLVYVEYTDSIESAIAREKQIKHWKREWS